MKRSIVIKIAGNRKRKITLERKQLGTDGNIKMKNGGCHLV